MEPPPGSRAEPSVRRSEGEAKPPVESRAEALVRGQGAKPPEAESFEAFAHKQGPKFAVSMTSPSKYGTDS